MTIKDCWFEALWRLGVPGDVIAASHGADPDGVNRHVPIGSEQKYIYRLMKTVTQAKSASREEHERLMRPVIEEMIRVGEYRQN
jgi:hypothetical protein